AIYRHPFSQGPFMIATSRWLPPTVDLVSKKETFRAEVMSGLSRRHKTLPCKYFYDEAGSRLFERITRLPEYYLTRTELAIMERHGAEMAALLGHGCLLLEYGSGSSIKTRILLRHLETPAGYVPIDICREQLYQAAQALSDDFPHLGIRPLCADFTAPLEPAEFGTTAGKRVVYFPGSTLGNFSPAEAIQLLKRTARLCGP